MNWHEGSVSHGGKDRRNFLKRNKSYTSVSSPLLSSTFKNVNVHRTATVDLLQKEPEAVKSQGLFKNDEDTKNESIEEVTEIEIKIETKEELESESESNTEETATGSEDNAFNNFWNIEESENIPEVSSTPVVPRIALRKKSQLALKKGSSKVFSVSQSTNRMDDFSFSQFRESFSKKGYPHMELIYIYSAWDIVKKVCL